MAHSPKRKLFLDLVRAVFRINGLLLADGDRMAEGVGLTSARWKVIGIIALSNSGMTVPGIARALGQSRQAVQRITDVMEVDGLVSYANNPRHKRSVLVQFDRPRAAGLSRAANRSGSVGHWLDRRCAG
jgi:DNA-binding MarR family transcriptional regulator